MTTTGAIVLVFAAFVGFEVLTVMGDRCGCNWKEFNGNCYYLSERGRYWDNAREDCQQRGGDLAVIPDRPTNVFITRLTNEQESVSFVWIGLRDTEGNRNFTWVDNQERFYTDWWYGDPEGTPISENGNCVATYIGGPHGRGSWSDRGCDTINYYVCQRKVDDDYFECSDGRNIPKKLVCDRTVDCSDASDELNCNL